MPRSNSWGDAFKQLKINRMVDCTTRLLRYTRHGLFAFDVTIVRSIGRMIRVMEQSLETLLTFVLFVRSTPPFTCSLNNNSSLARVYLIAILQVK